jgi:formylglycine-generating enzyme required for sulfatase activity
MNPDGTEQMEYYGSSSYWPNAMFYARPVPNHPTKFVAIVGGHHDVPRMGELVLFDPAKGQREADGVVQRIPGYGKKVEPIILDGLVGGSWPKFLHPWPLSDKYFIVSAKPTPQAKWGIYLVDVFDNMLLLKDQAGYALLEPTPLRPRPRPPIVSNRVETARNDATVHITDIYSGPGLAGIPRGTVKSLRLFTYHFAYHGVGGQVHRVGLDGPWDVKRVLGTVPVEADGSAYFRMPANTPISVQPLDAEGKAVQLMRSWMTAMPGERVSCVGCHDRQNGTGPNRSTLAQLKPPAEITPWYGTTRGFSFEREVQPVLDRHCIGCHDGQTGPSGEPIVDLRNGPPVQLQAASQQYNQHAKFTPSYLALRSLVRAPTIESDMHLLTPGEFHADTTKLVQLLRKDHYGVQLDAEAWDRLITWIDLNTPAHGAWSDILGIDYVARQRDRRREMMNRYAGRDEDPESIAAPSAALIPAARVTSVAASPTAKQNDLPQCPDWPFDAEEAVRRQRSAGAVEQVIELGSGVKLELVRIPAGQFVMGDPAGHRDEQPPTLVRVDKPLWIGRYEITNEQYRLFDPSHDSGLEEGDFLQFSQEERGYSVNGLCQPVVRVSWHEAIQFCEWLSKKTGLSFDLPAEAQWEYACRAGTNTPLSFGRLDDDFSPAANLADASLRAVDLYGWGLPVGAIPPWRPADTRFNDRFRVSAPVGTYRPNAWGLHDMHGNVAEWTRSSAEPYPYADSDGRNDITAAQRRVVRGGSWDDRPDRARSAFRLSYWPYQKVYDVGFRVVCAASEQ